MKAGARRAQRGLTLMEVLIAIVVVGLGVGVFLKLQDGLGSTLAGNRKMMSAGQMSEKHIEAMRISIARDTIGNWPPKDTSFSENGLKLVRTISNAKSLKDGSNLPNVRKVDIVITWGIFKTDSLDVETYVTKRF